MMIHIRKIIIGLALGASVLLAGCEDSPTPTYSPTSNTQTPSVNLTSPANNAIGVAQNKVISVTFSEAMNGSTINNQTFTLKLGTTAVAGMVSYSGLTAIFRPILPLMKSAKYTATISNTVKSALGKHISSNVSWSFTIGANTLGLAKVNLGAAENYVILAKTAITNIPTSVVTGNIAISPAAASYITGFSLTKATGYATAQQVVGKIYAADMAAPTPINLTTAVNNMITAYNDAAGRPSPDFIELGTGNIGGKTLAPGLYKWTSGVTAPTNFVISGSSNDVWIFQIAGNLLLGTAVNMTLSGGARPENIFWQVAGNVTLGVKSNFKGIVLSKTAIKLQTNAVFTGRALAQSAVVLDANKVTKPY